LVWAFRGRQVEFRGRKRNVTGTLDRPRTGQPIQIEGAVDGSSPDEPGELSRGSLHERRHVEIDQPRLQRDIVSYRKRSADAEIGAGSIGTNDRSILDTERRGRIVEIALK